MVPIASPGNLNLPSDSVNQRTFKVCVEAAHGYGGASNYISPDILNRPGNRARGRLAKRLVWHLQDNNTYEKRQKSQNLWGLCLLVGRSSRSEGDCGNLLPPT